MSKASRKFWRTSRAGLIDDVQVSLVDRAFTLGDRDIAACITPRQDIEWIEAEAPFAEIREQVRGSPHARFPVRRGEDDIVGVASAKAIFSCDASEATLPREAIEPAMFVQESANVLSVLEQFRRDRVEFAVVVDEYGELLGVATLMDILRAVVGRDGLQTAPPIADDTSLAAAGPMVFDGSTSMDDFRRDLGRPNLGTEEDFNYHTAAGFALYRLRCIRPSERVLPMTALNSR